MKIIQITPGAGESFYCENCLRDKALVLALRKAGHDALMVPLYLPPLAVGPHERYATPIFFGGINVYLQQKSALFRRTPRWLDRLLDSRLLLNWAGPRAGMTDARDLGETAVSVLLGERGRQAKELQRLLEFLGGRHRPDVVCLSNAMLMGLARRVKESLGAEVVGMLEDEEGFLDALAEPWRREAWDLLREGAGEIDAFAAVSRYYADRMCRRLALDGSNVHVVHSGIDPEGYAPAPSPPERPVIGFLSQMSRDKGLDTLVEAFELLKRDARHGGLTLRVTGGRTHADEPFLKGLRRRIRSAGLRDDVQFLDDFSRPGRQAFLPGISVLSVPTRRGEAFGLYVLEALACGVPVVMPDHGAMPELLAATGGGALHRPNDASSLAEALDAMLRRPRRARAMGLHGREVVLRDFSVQRAADAMVRIFEKAMAAPAKNR